MVEKTVGKYKTRVSGTQLPKSNNWDANQKATIDSSLVITTK